jgi:hypothetical protein
MREAHRTGAGGRVHLDALDLDVGAFACSAEDVIELPARVGEGVRAAR